MIFFFREYCQEFVTSFVAHLGLPGSVTITMKAFAEGFGNHDEDIFMKMLKKDSNIQVRLC